jgi:hypothetical protein
MSVILPLKEEPKVSKCSRHVQIKYFFELNLRTIFDSMSSQREYLHIKRDLAHGYVEVAWPSYVDFILQSF